MNEQKEITVYELVANGVEILDGIGYANADEVKRFGTYIFQVSDMLKTCIKAWELEANAQKQTESDAKPEIELIETGIEGEETDEQEVDS